MFRGNFSFQKIYYTNVNRNICVTVSDLEETDKFDDLYF